MPINVRYASLEDLDNAFQWWNDPVIRAMSVRAANGTHRPLATHPHVIGSDH